MVNLFKKSIISLLMMLLIVEPLFIFSPQKARATAEMDSATEDISADGGDDTPITKSETPAVVLDLADQVNSSAENATGYSVGFDDQVLGMQDARLIFNTTDLSAIRSLYCLSDLKPDFSVDLEALYNYLPTNLRPASIDELSKIRLSDLNRFQNLVYQAQKAWGASPDARAVLQKEKTDLEDATFSGVDPVMIDSTLGAGDKFKTLKCLTGLNTQQLAETDSAYLDQLITSALESTVIDIRVIKMLNYLVIPKNQGGAGHWRVRVKKLIQDTARPYSNESETVRLSLGKKATDTSTVVNCANMTAAECGVAQGADADNQNADANITAEDQNGDKYDAYLQTLDNAESTGLSVASAPDRNISAHTKGQAVDIMELDDIRCTLTIVKKRRIGGDTTTREKKVLRPVKLAWQTSASYDASGGNSVDMMGILKGVAQDEMRGLLDDLNGDVTDYQGDLSDANFSDIVGIIGKTIFGQLLNSPGHNFAGFNTSETLQKLGAMYFADYLGLPREIFVGRSITSLEDLQVIIGETAIEKRAGLPFGSLESLNVKKSAGGPKVYDLEGTLINMGKRKLEYEMNLNVGDLKDYQEGVTAQVLSALIGKRVIEKGLNLPKDSFRGTDYRDLRKNLGDFRASILFQDPTYIDNTLHITPGTTKQLIAGTLSPTEFVEKVGETRKNDTINGFKYLSANNSAYNLPDGAWSDALLGKTTGFITVGRFALSRVVQQNLTFSKYLYTKGNGNITEAEFTAMKDLNLTATPDDLGAAAAQQWLLENLSKTEKTSCQIPEKVTQKVSVTLKKPDGSTEVKDLNVDINEEQALSLGLISGDLSRMFGCASASPRSVFSRVGSKLLYYGVANKLLDSTGKVKIDLMDTTPELQTDNPEVNFYLSRITRTLELVRKIKDDWKNETGVELGPINEHIDAIISAFNNLNVTTIAGAKETARGIANEVDGLLADCENIRIQNQDKARKVDTTILNVNELIRGVSELIAGKPIASADMLTIKQINASQAFASTWTSAGANGTTSAQNNSNKSSSGSTRSTGFSPAALFDLLTHRIDAVDFFVRIGAAQAENGLGLPQNSLYYLVQNYEKAGIKSIDAFYLAIGQAKVEQEFSMPSFYFQGDVLNDKAPDFNNDYKALLKYAGSTIEFYRMQYASGGSATVQIAKAEDYVKWTKKNDQFIFKAIVEAAKLAWYEEFKVQYAAKGGQLMNEKDLNDVAKNVVARGYNDAIRGAGDDIMFRFGISGRLDALEAGGFSAITDAQALKVDKKLGLKNGSTAALIKKQKVPLGNGADLLKTDEKQQLAAALNLPESESKTALIDVFLKLINGDITLSQLGRQGLDPSFVDTNPYLKQYGDTGDQESCPISYVGTDNTITWQDFKARTDTLSQVSSEGNTYCVVDKVGKHCFKNKTDAQTYVTEHKTDQFADIIDALAKAIETHAGLSVSETLNTQSIRERILQFINGTINSVFTEAEYATIFDGGLTLSALGYTALDIDVLKRLFTRTGDQTPLATFKRAVGQAEAKKILSWKLFSSLGIDIPPGIFNADDLYAILNGDMKPLFRVGAYFLDKSLGFDPGTTNLIITALNPKNLKCALADAGAKMLGRIVGLDSVPIRGNSPGDIVKSIGEAKVESTLGLPKGMFRGASLTELITKMKPMNFALIFKIPIYTERLDNGETLTTISRNDLTAILGASKASSLKSATGTYQLKAIVDYLSSAPALTAEASAAVTNIDSKLPEYIRQILSAYGSGALQVGTDTKMKDYYAEMEQFKTFMNGLDGAFGLDFGETAKLARGEISPDQYNEKIGMKMVVKLGAVKLAEALGLDDATAEAAANVAINFQKFFTCDNMSPITGEGCQDKTFYHNWGMLYSNLATIFKFDLDSKAKVPPGTFQRIFNDPSQAHWVLLEIAASRLDTQFKLEGTLTFSELYRRVYSSQTTQGKDATCITTSKTAAGFDTNQVMLAMQNNQRLIDRGKADNATPEEAAAGSAAAANNIVLAGRIDEVNAAIQTCQNNWRKGNDDSPTLWGTTSQWLKDGISEKIHNAILDINIDGERVGVDMPLKDINELVWKGDLRYLQIAGMALAVNIYQVKNSDTKHPVPASMRISYDDIRQAFFPDAASLQMARDAATFATLNPNGEAYDRSRIFYGYGDLCPPGGDFLSGMAHCTSDATSVPGRNSATLASAGGVAMAEGYGYNPATGLVDGAAALRDLQAAVANGPNQMAAIKANCDNFMTNTTCQAAYNQAEADLATNSRKLTTLQDNQNASERNLRKYNMERLEFRLMDQMLFGTDQNVFAGFSQALFKGDEKVKIAALQRYMINGLKNGNLFGIKFNALPNVDDWLRTLGFLTDWSKNGWGNGTAALNTFVDNGGFNFFTNYLSGQSEKWLGVKLSPAMVGGIIVGATTGQWGSLSPMADNSTNVFTSTKGVKIPTLGNAVTNWGMNKIFAWADKALGFPVGKSYEFFTMAKDIYLAQKLLSTYKLMDSSVAGMANITKSADVLKKTKEGADLLTAQANLNAARNNLDIARVSGQQAMIDAAEAANKTAQEAFDAANAANKLAKEVQFAQLQIAVYTKIATYFIDKWLAGTYASLEESLGLVPGSLSIVVDAAVGVAVTSVVVANSSAFAAGANGAATAGSTAGASLNAAAMSALWVAVAIFVLINLFGVYDMDISLTCTADGYWPEFEPAPSSSVADVSGIGTSTDTAADREAAAAAVSTEPTPGFDYVSRTSAGTWDGMNAAIMKRKTIEVAQYKASRLIGDVLYMQSNPAFKDIVPSQIMTGRAEDVATWNNVVSDYMCKWIGNTAQGGICGGNTRAGLWANPQTIAWTHIGY